MMRDLFGNYQPRNPNEDTYNRQPHYENAKIHISDFLRICIYTSGSTYVFWHIRAMIDFDVRSRWSDCGFRWMWLPSCICGAEIIIEATTNS